MKQCKVVDMKIWWNVTVWPKGQVVIPKEVRDLMEINPWDSLVTISKWSAVGFVKNEDIKAVMEYLQWEME